jgi:hypothetical protein
MPVTVAEQSKACTVFARSEAGTVGSNPTQGMDVWGLCVYVRACVILCVQAETLRRADHPSEEFYLLSKV